MSSVQKIVSHAMRQIGALDLAETEPSAIEMENAIAVLNQMVASWEADGLNIKTRTLPASFDNASLILRLEDTSQLAPGLNVSGTGIASSRIVSIDSAQRITLDVATTQAGDGVDVTFTALPFEPKFEQGVIALLGLMLAPTCGIMQVPPIVEKLAASGWTALSANFMPTPAFSPDPALLYTSVRRSSGTILGEDA